MKNKQLVYVVTAIPGNDYPFSHVFINEDKAKAKYEEIKSRMQDESNPDGVFYEHENDCEVTVFCIATDECEHILTLCTTELE